MAESVSPCNHNTQPSRFCASEFRGLDLIYVSRSARAVFRSPRLSAATPALKMEELWDAGRWDAPLAARDGNAKADTTSKQETKCRSNRELTTRMHTHPYNDFSHSTMRRNCPLALDRHGARPIPS